MKNLILLVQKINDFIYYLIHFLNIFKFILINFRDKEIYKINSFTYINI